MFDKSIKCLYYLIIGKRENYGNKSNESLL